MNSNKSQLVIIENLTLFNWVFSIFIKIIKIKYSARNDVRLHYIDCSVLGKTIAKLALLPFRISLEKLDFKLMDMKDEEAVNIEEAFRE